MEDDISSVSKDLVAACKLRETQIMKLPPAPAHFPFTVKPGTNIKIDNVNIVLDTFSK